MEWWVKLERLTMAQLSWGKTILQHLIVASLLISVAKHLPSATTSLINSFVKCFFLLLSFHTLKETRLHANI